MLPKRRTSGHHPLPYRLLAGVVPCAGGWLAVTGKLHGINLVSDGATVYGRFTEILEQRPSFDIVALATPIGLPSRASSPDRACDREARALLGWPRAGAIAPAPPRSALHAKTYERALRREPSLSQAEFGRRRRIAEIDSVIMPFHQRAVFEVHPELSFFQLTDDIGLRHPKHSRDGRVERRSLVEPRIQSIGRVIDHRVRGSSLDNRIDGAAALWTARRIASRGVQRLPLEAEWDDHGLRMELVR